MRATVFLLALFAAVGVRAQVPVPPPLLESIVPIYGATATLDTEYEARVYLTNLGTTPALVTSAVAFAQPGGSCVQRPSGSINIGPGETRYIEPLQCSGVAALQVFSTRALVVTNEVTETVESERCYSVRVASTTGRWTMFPAETRVVLPAVPIGWRQHGPRTHVNVFFFSRGTQPTTFAISENSNCGRQQRHVLTVSPNELHSLTLQSLDPFCGGDVIIWDRHAQIDVVASAPFFAFASEVAGGHGTFHMPMVPMN